MSLPDSQSDDAPSSTVVSLKNWLHILSGEFEELREGVKQAVQVADLDPEIALTRVRKVLELIIREVYQRRINEKPGTRPLENLTDRLRKDGFLPDRIEAYASSVRKMGNVGTHAFGEKVTRKDVYRSLGQLLPVLEWYFESERQQRVAPAMKAPANPVDVEKGAAPLASGVAAVPSVRRRFSYRLLVGSSMALAVALLLCVLVLGVGVQQNWFRHDPPVTTPAVTPVIPVTTVTPAARLQLQLSLQAKKIGQDSLVSLDAANVLPLQAGDALHIEVHAAQPAYLYVLNMDAEGKVWPMYPWRNDEWDNLPEEKPRDFFCIPDPSKGTASKLATGPSGIESVVVLARATPLTLAEREQLRSLLRSWPVDQGKFDPLRAAVTIGEDEFRFADEHDHKVRGHIKVDDTVEAHDPVLRLRRLLQGDIRAGSGVAWGLLHFPREVRSRGARDTVSSMRIRRCERYCAERQVACY